MKLTFAAKSGIDSQWEADLPEWAVTHDIETASLTVVLEQFKYFLQGCGFVIAGNIVVEEEK